MEKSNFENMSIQNIDFTLLSNNQDHSVHKKQATDYWSKYII